MAKFLTEQDFIDAANSLGCEVAAIKAVAFVESGGKSGFKADGVTPVAPALRMVLRVFDLRTVWLDENLSLAVLQPERR